MRKGTYATTINCFDGKIQAPTRKYLKRRFRVEFVDPITEPGIEKILTDDSGNPDFEFLKRWIRDVKLKTSIVDHGSRFISIAAHHKCLGNSAGKEEKLTQLVKVRDVVRQMIKDLGLDHLDIEIVLLWINEHLLPEEVHVGADGTISCHERVLPAIMAV